MPSVLIPTIVGCCVVSAVLFFTSNAQTFNEDTTGGIFSLQLSELTDACQRCLCRTATGCNMTLGCNAGYCGPLKISRVYWIDAGKITLPEDDPERAGAFEDCALSYSCSLRIVKNYISKFGRDCNGDGVTNCDDFAMINFNGGYQCHPPLNRNEFGRAWLERYEACRPL